MSIRPLIALGFTLLMTACGGGSGADLDTVGRPLSDVGATAPTTPTADFQSIQDTVFTPVCTVCHAGGSAPVGLKLDNANSYAMLVGVSSVEVPTLLRVAPGDPDESYLMQKLLGTAAVGAQMPLGGPPLEVATIELLRQWIIDGAQPAGQATPPATAPTVVSTTPENNATLSAVVVSLSAAFSQPMDAGLVSDLTFTLTASGGDGTFADGNEVMIAVTAVTLLNAQTISMDLTGAVLPDDTYEARLVGTGATALADVNGLVLDGDADGTAGGDFSWQFTIDTMTNAPQPTWRWIQDNVFTPVCTQCHIDGGIASFMLLDELNSFAATVNVLSTEVSTLNRIEPGEPDASYLVQKLEGTAAVGDPMPLGLPPLEANVIAAIREWIAAGVPLEPGDPMPDPVVDTELPVISINPVASPVSGPVDVTFTATDNIGLTAVRLYADGLLAGTDNTAPFAITWDTTVLPDGPHLLTAEAEDAAGNVGQSAVTEITVVNGIGDFAAPMVSILAVPDPVAGSVTVTVNAVDNAAVVSASLSIDGALLATDTTPPYQFNWDTTTYSNGVHTLDATAVDSSGNIGSATTVSVTVDNTLPPDTTPPIVALQTPVSPISGVVSVNIFASDAGGITTARLFVDDQLVGATTSEPYAISWDSTTTVDGIHVLRAEADDNAGNVGSSGNVSVTVSNAVGPEASWRWIQDNVFTTRCINCHIQGGIADFLWLNENASYDQLVNVPTSEGGPPFRVEPGNPDNSSLVQRLEGTLSPRMPLGGAALLPAELAAVRQWIADGALPEMPADTVAPSVSVVSPGITVTGVVTVTAEATDNIGVAAVRFFVLGSLAASDTTAPYEWVWDTTVIADGSYELTAQADDLAGNTAISDPVLVMVDSTAPVDITPPTVVILTAPGSVSGIVSIAIDAFDNVGVTQVSLAVNGTDVGNTTTVPYAIDWDTSMVANGDHTLVATARDAAGNSAASIAETFNVSNAATPVLSLQVDAPGNVFRGDDFFVAAFVHNDGADSPPLYATLGFAPLDSIRFEQGSPTQAIGVAPSMGSTMATWLMRADEAGVTSITVSITDIAGTVLATQDISVSISD